MNENLDKENKEPELLYRLGKRNPLMVLAFSCSYPPCLLRYITTAGCAYLGFWAPHF